MDTLKPSFFKIMLCTARVGYAIGKLTQSLHSLWLTRSVPSWVVPASTFCVRMLDCGQFNWFDWSYPNPIADDPWCNRAGGWNICCNCWSWQCWGHGEEEQKGGTSSWQEREYSNTYISHSPPGKNSVLFILKPLKKERHVTQTSVYVARIDYVVVKSILVMVVFVGKMEDLFK